jgi:uncharacterized protein YkwD
MKMNLRHACMALFVIVAVSCSKESEERPVAFVAGNATEVESELFNLVNDHRVSLGQTPLSFSQIAYDYANQHTEYMISTGSLSHDNFTARASGIAAEVKARAVSENVARDYTSALKALEGWLASESHRKTMEGEFSHTAISVKQDASGMLYFTQLFYLE